MRAVAYNIKSSEKEPLAIANHKKHDITLISNSLTAETISYAQGKEAVIVVHDDKVSAEVIGKLAAMGVKYIATRSTTSSHIDLDEAARQHIRVASVPEQSMKNIPLEEQAMALARETILNLDKWQQNRCLGKACICSRSCDQLNLKKSGNE